MSRAKILIVAATFILFFSIVHVYADCPKGRFSNIEGPERVNFGEKHTYSSIADGKFRSVNWSVRGGHLIKHYNEGKKHICEIVWDVPASSEYRIKIYGVDGCNIDREQRLVVDVIKDQLSLDPATGVKPAPQSRINPSTARNIAGMLREYYQNKTEDGVFNEELSGILARNLTGKINYDEAVDILWAHGIKIAMARSFDKIINNALNIKDRDLTYRTLKRDAEALLKKFYLKRNIDQNLLDRWADIIARTRNPRLEQVKEFQNRLIDGASDLTITHLKNADIIPKFVTTSRQ